MAGVEQVFDGCAAPGAPAPAAGRRRIGAAADLADRYALLLYGLLLAAFAGLFVVAARFLTLEADESWILLSTAHAFGVPVPVTDAIGNPTITTGGPHLLIHGLLALATMDVFAHRLVSLAAAGCLVILVYRTLRILGHAPALAAAGGALFAATPGFVLQAGLGTGETVATLFLIGAGVHWTRRGAGAMRRAAMTGLLLGSACAARVNCAAAAPALVLYALMMPDANGRTAMRALFAAAVAALVTGVSAAAYQWAGRMGVPAGRAEYLTQSTGIGGARKPLTDIVQAIATANDYLPIPLLVAVVLAWAALRFAPGSARPSRPSTDVAGVLMFFGAAILAAWVLFAPIPHLRYLWPAMGCILLAGIVLLTDFWSRAKEPATRLAMHGFVVALCLYALVTGALVAANGESLVLAYRAAGSSPRFATPRHEWFRAARDQKALAAFLAGRPPSAEVYAINTPVTYPLTYLSRRSIVHIDALAGAGERLLVMQPADYAIWKPEPAFDAWRRAYTVPAFRSGDYAALRIADGAPPVPAKLFSVGRNDVY